MNNQSNPFALIIVGGLMFLLGIVVGYFSRPLITAQATNLAVHQEATASVEETGGQVVGGTAQRTPSPRPPAAPAAQPDIAPTQPPMSGANRRALMDSVVAGTRHFQGDPNAPVTIVEFSDFQCPYCGRFAVETKSQIDETYVEAGQVRFGYRHFAFLGEPSLWAAEASECAADQDAFWPYHDRLVQRLAVEGQRDFTKANLKAFAAELGLDTGAFNLCMDEGKYAAAVEAASSEAQELGVRSTPSFLVNGRPLVGAQPFSVFEQVIQQAMAEDQ